MNNDNFNGLDYFLKAEEEVQRKLMADFNRAFDLNNPAWGLNVAMPHSMNQNEKDLFMYRPHEVLLKMEPDIYNNELVNHIEFRYNIHCKNQEEGIVDRELESMFETETPERKMTM